MLRLDVSSTFAKILTPSLGIPDQELLQLRTGMKRYVSEWLEERRKGEHAWALDPYNKRLVSQVEDIAKQVKRRKIQTVLWIGIGGSGLGPKVIQEAFEGPRTIEFIVIDSVDPSALTLPLDMLDWKHTLVVVASKSGSTLETMSAFFLYWQELKKTLGKKASEHVIAITDPKEGPLRTFCQQQGIQSLPIPPDVGGRFSIFSPIGLLPLALLEADVRAFLQGAKEMDTLCQHEHLEKNPAALLATTQFFLESKRGYLIRVIMPYVHRLQSIGRWDQQLLSESLGKTELHNPFPLAALGTQDHHSLLQQWMAGPRKSWHLFVREEEKTRLHIPHDLPALFASIEGKTFSQVLDACAEGTAKALTSAKRPHATITLPRADEYHVGQLFFLLMAEVIFLAKLYRIDPYGQPAVEIGKKLTKELLSHSRE